MRYAAFTVDVDRDINEPRSGQLEGCSRGYPTPRFSSTLRGTALLADLLNELGIKGTFFLEGEMAERCGKGELYALLHGQEIASHGYAHEDLTGTSTGIIPSIDWLDAIVGRSLAAIEDAFGRRPAGFRAPYQHFDGTVASVLARRGLVYDSSLFADAPGRPYRLQEGLMEVPLLQGTGPDGRRMQSYLWPLHEGRRPPSHYLHLMPQQEGGVMVLADHSWHVVESLKGPRTDDQIEQEMGSVRAILEGLLEQGVEFMTLEEHVARGSEW